MRLILLVYRALLTFERGATRRQLEQECNLPKRAIENGLEGLLRRGLLEIDGAPRRLTVYRLCGRMDVPADLRGHYPRAPERIRGHVAVEYSPARPPSQHTQPGALRIEVKAVRDVQRHAPQTFGPCLLAEVWRKR